MNAHTPATRLSHDEVLLGLAALGEDPQADRVRQVRELIDASTLPAEGRDEAVRAAVDAARIQLDASGQKAQLVGQDQQPSPGATYSWSRFAAKSERGYEVSSGGDVRFSALRARLRDGRTIEEAYQLDVKGYRSLGNDWRLGKGKPPRQPMTHGEVWAAYRGLWEQWARENPQLMAELRQAAAGKVLTDRYATTPVSQARALAEILTDGARQQLGPDAKLHSPVQNDGGAQQETQAAGSEPRQKRASLTLADVINMRFEDLKRTVTKLLVENRNFETGYYAEHIPATGQFIRKVLPGWHEGIESKIEALQDLVGRELAASENAVGSPARHQDSMCVAPTKIPDPRPVVPLDPSRPLYDEAGREYRVVTSSGSQLVTNWNGFFGVWDRKTGECLIENCEGTRLSNERPSPEWIAQRRESAMGVFSAMHADAAIGRALERTAQTANDSAAPEL